MALEKYGGKRFSVAFSSARSQCSLFLQKVDLAVEIWVDPQIMRTASACQRSPLLLLLIGHEKLARLASSISWIECRHFFSANVRQMFIQLLACGIDPEKTILFQQSTVSTRLGLCMPL